MARLAPIIEQVTPLRVLLKRYAYAVPAGLILFSLLRALEYSVPTPPWQADEPLPPKVAPTPAFAPDYFLETDPKRPEDVFVWYSGDQKALLSELRSVLNSAQFTVWAMHQTYAGEKTKARNELSPKVLEQTELGTRISYSAALLALADRITLRECKTAVSAGKKCDDFLESEVQPRSLLCSGTAPCNLRDVLDAAGHQTKALDLKALRQRASESVEWNTSTKAILEDLKRREK